MTRFEQCHPVSEENTLRTHRTTICFCRRVWIPRPNQSFFCSKSPKTSNFGKFCCFDNFAVISKKNANNVLKRPIGYRNQSFFNWKTAREVYKKVYKHLEIKKDFSPILGRFEDLFTYENYEKHSACLFKKSAHISVFEITSFGDVFQKINNWSNN